MTEDPPPLREIPELSRKSYLTIHTFQALNAVSFTIAMGSPLTLFARELGASATVLGLIASFMPFLSMLQLLVAPHAARTGYRSVAVGGWGGRVATLVLLCVLPWIGPLVPRDVSVAALVASLFLFNFLRGFAAGSWLPWMTALVPRRSRARFLTRDRTFTATAAVLALSLSGIILSGEHSALGYSAMFGLSLVAGAISLVFLNRIPPAPKVVGSSGEPVRTVIPWLNIFKDRSFMLYAAYGFGMSLMGAAAGTFNLIFIREEVGLPDGAIVQIAAIAQAVSMVALWYGRNRLDERGSKRYIYLGLVWLVVYFLVWLAMAGRLVPGMLIVAPIVMIFNGFVGGMLDLAGTRMLMNICGDRHGSSQFFAVYQTGANLATGFSPLLWGIALDAMRGGALNRYAVFFGAEIALVVIIGLVLIRVKER